MGQQVEQKEEVLANILLKAVRVVALIGLLDALQQLGDSAEEDAPDERPEAAQHAADLNHHTLYTHASTKQQYIYKYGGVV